MEKFALNLAEDGRILSATYEQFGVDGMPIVEALPEGDISDYRYVDGEYIHDPLPKPDPVVEPTTEERLAELEEALELLLSGVTE